MHAGEMLLRDHHNAMHAMTIQALNHELVSVRHPHTDVAPILLEPHTPLPVPQAAMPVLLPPSFGALEFELEELDRSLFCSPNP